MRDYDAMYDYLEIGKVVPGLGRIINVGRDLPKAERHRDELHGTEWHPLRELVEALPEPALIELTALMWFGRGDGDFAACLAHAKRASRGAGDVDYVLGKPLAKYVGRASKNLVNEPLAGCCLARRE